MTKREQVIKKLRDEQRPDGSFGRFHTADSMIKQKIPTTQAAAWFMYENAFTRNDEICDKTCLYMERLLNDLALWPDAWEKNKWFKPAVPLFVASSLALFGSEDEKYNEICEIWINLLISVFESDLYSPIKSNEISIKKLGVEIDGSYIGFQSINHLALYAHNTNKIPLNIQNSYLKWLHDYDGVITYTNARLNNISKTPMPIKIRLLLSKFDGFKNKFPDIVIT